MPQIVQEVDIDAPPEKVFEAISTTQGLNSWWTDDSHSEPKLAGRAEFGFNKRETIFNMEVSVFEDNEEIGWRCVNGPSDWMGTQVLFLVTPRPGGSTVRLEHINWRSTDGSYEDSKETWGKLLQVLKQYAEGKSPGPYFKSK